MKHEATSSIMDSDREIQKSSQKFFSGTLMSRLLGLTRDVLMASFFGASASLAALMVAFRFSNLLRRLFGEGALHAAFVPLYENLRAKSSKEGASFFVSLSMILFLFLLGITSIVLFALVGFLKWTILAPTHEIARLSLILFPSLFFICHAAFCASFLQCHGIYFLPALAPVQFNLFWILGIFLASILSPSQPVEVLACFVSLGLIAQWALLLPKVWITVKKEGFIFAEFSLRRSKAACSKILAPLSLGLLGTSATQINNALDSVFARLVDLKGPAYLWYALRLEQVPLALFGLSLSGALLPTLSRFFIQNRRDYMALLKQGIHRGLGLLMPCQIALIGFAPLIVDLIYRRGSFGEVDALQTTYCLQAYALGLVFQGLNLLLSSAFFSSKNYHTPLKSTCLALSFNLVCNSYFAFVLNLGPLSIALATSISAFVQFIYLSLQLKKAKLYEEIGEFWMSLIKVTAFCWLAFLGSEQLPVSTATHFLGLFTTFSIKGGGYLGLLWGLGLIFKSPEIEALFAFLRMRNKKNSAL